VKPKQSVKFKEDGLQVDVPSQATVEEQFSDARDSTLTIVGKIG